MGVRKALDQYQMKITLKGIRPPIWRRVQVPGAIRLGSLHRVIQMVFTYTYDFGDDWEHEIVVEKIVAGDSGSERPLCLGGKRHRPPEDCGGPWGYREFLKAIGDPRHEEHDAMLDWVGGDFDSPFPLKRMVSIGCEIIEVIPGAGA
jgi:hypothetical protein